MKMYAKLLASIVPVVLIVGCTTTPKVAEKSAPVEERAAPASASSAATPAPATSTGVEVLAAPDKGGFKGDPLNDPASLLSKRVVFFEFDSSEIKDDARPIIEAHAAYLAERPKVSITLEGHADERGSREYNLALGERRAKAVQQLMQIKGVSSKQLDVVSFGEEHPVALGHDEAAWAQNRRVELVYPK